MTGRLNPLLRFKSLGAGQGYLFRGNDAELFRIPDPAHATLAAAYLDLMDAPERAPDLPALAARTGLPVEQLAAILLTDDLPPRLGNEFDDPGFLPAVEGHMRLFFVFPSYDCNLACAYCTYSGIYPSERPHLPVRLDQRGVDAAVQLMRESARHEPAAEVVFYGDEPLTNHRAVLRIMDGLRDDAVDGTAFRFAVITNGLLLSETLARDFIARGVKLQLSLDGPAAVHDRYRRTRGGEPTHARVMERLAMLAALDEGYLATKVGISCTLAPPFDLLAVDRWFREQPLLAAFDGYRGNFSVSVMNPTAPGVGACHPAYQPGDDDRYREQARDLFQRFAADLLRGEREDTRFLPAALFMAPFHRFAARGTEGLDHPGRWRHTGDCLPGIGALAIGADRRLFVCNTMNLHPIGDTAQGVDPAVLHAQRGSYLAVRNGPCRRCWINRFCPLCPAAFKYAEGPYLDSLDCAAVQRQYDDVLDLYIRAVTTAPERLQRFMEPAARPAAPAAPSERNGGIRPPDPWGNAEE